jgi:hypothetical protein
MRRSWRGGGTWGLRLFQQRRTAATFTCVLSNFAIPFLSRSPPPDRRDTGLSSRRYRPCRAKLLDTRAASPGRGGSPGLLLAAHRAGLTDVIISRCNEPRARPPAGVGARCARGATGRRGGRGAGAGAGGGRRARAATPNGTANTRGVRRCLSGVLGNTPRGRIG